MIYKYLMLFTLTLSIFGKEKYPNISTDITNRLDFHTTQKIRSSLIQFYSNVAKEVKLESSKKYTLNDIFGFEAYATDGMCFYAGYESQMLNGVCMKPEKYSSQYTPCVIKNQFKCNPTLFGDNACVDNNNTSDLLNECEKSSSSNYDEIIGKIAENPEELQNFVGKVKQYCENIKNSDACSIFDKKISQLKKKMDEKISKEVENAKNNMKEQQKAFGVLDGCKRTYDIENQGFFDAKSNRDILGSISGSIDCKLDTSNLKIQSFDKLNQSLQNIELKFVEKKRNNLVDLANTKSLELSLNAILATQITQTGKLDTNTKAKILKKYPHIKDNNKLVQTIDKKISEFNKNKESVKEMLHKPEEATLNSFNKLSKDINLLCKQIREDDRNANNRVSFLNRKAFSLDSYRDSKEEKQLYAEYQQKMKSIFEDFTKSNKQSSLFATDTFRNNFGTYTDSLAEDCAEGSNFKAFNSSMDKKLLAKAQKDLNNVLLSSIGNIEDTTEALQERDNDDIDDELERILKYQPYLIADLLNDPNYKDKELLAKYICKKSLSIYNNDEWFKVVDYGVASATIIAGIGVNLVPGIGQVASAALFASLGTASASLATFKVIDANNVIDNSEIALATDKADLTRASAAIDNADTQKAYAIAEIAVEATGVGLLAKGAKVAKKAASATEATAKVTQETLQQTTQRIPKGTSGLHQASKGTKVNVGEFIPKPSVAGKNLPEIPKGRLIEGSFTVVDDVKALPNKINVPAVRNGTTTPKKVSPAIEGELVTNPPAIRKNLPEIQKGRVIEGSFTVVDDVKALPNKVQKKGSLAVEASSKGSETLKLRSTTTKSKTAPESRPRQQLPTASKAIVLAEASSLLRNISSTESSNQRENRQNQQRDSDEDADNTLDPVPSQNSDPIPTGPAKDPAPPEEKVLVNTNISAKSDDCRYEIKLKREKDSKNKCVLAVRDMDKKGTKEEYTQIGKEDKDGKIIINKSDKKDFYVFLRCVPNKELLEESKDKKNFDDLFSEPWEAAQDSKGEAIKILIHQKSKLAMCSNSDDSKMQKPMVIPPQMKMDQAPQVTPISAPTLIEY